MNFVRTSVVALAMAAMVGFMSSNAQAQEALVIGGGPAIGHVSPGFYPGCTTGLHGGIYGGGIYGGGIYGGGIHSGFGGYYSGFGTVYPGIGHSTYYPGVWTGGYVQPGLVYCPVRGWGHWH